MIYQILVEPIVECECSILLMPDPNVFAPLAIGLQSGPTEYTDLDFLVGSWEEDPAFDAAIADFERLDEGMWR